MNALNMSQWSLRPEDEFTLAFDASSGSDADLDNLTDGAMAVPQPDLGAVVLVSTVAALDHSAISTTPIELPFTNLDPSDLEGKEDLPDIDLHTLSNGSMESEVEVYNWAGGLEAEFYLVATNHQMESGESVAQISELFHVQEIEVDTLNLNGRDLIVSYETNSDFGFEGSFYGQSAQFHHLSINSESGESFRADMFQANGDPVLTSYGYYETVEIAGELYQNGITDFTLGFEVSYELEMIGFGSYMLEATVSIYGEINYDHGITRPVQFEEYWRTPFPDLESVEFGHVPDGLSDHLMMIQFSLGDAWDELANLNDLLEAAFVQFREDGHYDEWDLADQGIENPFTFDLPPVDQWV